jgi:hypothetical protein
MPPLARASRGRFAVVVPLRLLPQIRVFAKRPGKDLVKVLVDNSMDVADLKDLIVKKLKLDDVAPDDLTLKLELEGKETAPLDGRKNLANAGVVDGSIIIVHDASVSSAAPAPSKEVFDPPVGALWGGRGGAEVRSRPRTSRLSLTDPSYFLPHPVPSNSHPSQSSRLATEATT